MPTYGKVGDYEPDSEDWPQYVEALQFHDGITSADNMFGRHWP